MKNILKTFALLILISLSSCEAEKDLITETKNSNPIKEYTFKQISQQPKFNKAYHKFTDGLNNMRMANRVADSDFEIDSTTVKEVTIGDKTTYTMAIKRPTPDSSYFENLIIQSKAGDTTKAYIAKFTPNQAINQNETQHSLGFKGTVQVKEIAFDSSSFSNRLSLQCLTIKWCNIGDSIHEAYSPACNCIATTTVCYEYGTDQGPTYNYGSGGSNYYGGNNGGGGTGGIALTPVKPTYTSVNLTTMLSLNPAQEAWVNAPAQFRIKKDLQVLLFENPLNNIALANQIIIRMMNNPTLFTSTKPFMIEDKIDDTQLDPCGRGVLTSLKNTTDSDIAKVLAKLDANGSVYNTAIKWEHNDATINGTLQQVPHPANTAYDSAFNYTIYFNPDYTDETKLFKAATIMHELIHAYFMSLFDDYHNAHPTNAGSFDDFPFLFDLYVLKKYPASTSAVDIQHQQMAQSYVDALARALQEYQTGIPVPAGTNPDQIYTDLAWGGLKGTPVFDVTYPVGNPDRQRIINRYNCEGTGHPIGQGTPNQQNPIGLPCL